MMNAFVFYHGPSALDGSPIVAIATGLDARGSRNDKTGKLIQTWIMRADVAPHVAVHTGQDESVCGTCPHRGTIVDGKNVGRSCYVKVFQAPLSVFKTFEAGKYQHATPEEASELLRGHLVRLGSYGDPAAVPFDVWERMLQHIAAKTGYSHQWRTCDPRFARYCMASCDTAEDFAAATAAGWRTFRVRLADEALQSREIVCPASEEAGKRTSCSECRACGGTSAKARVNIAIVAHGAKPTVNAFARMRATALS